MRHHSPHNVFTALLSLCACTFFAGESAAQTTGPYFVEANIGHGEAEFEPTYYFVDGAPPKTYADKGKGSVATFRVGYSKPLLDALTLDLSADLIYQQTDFTLFFSSEPAEFKYDVPLTLGLIASPTWQLNSQWRLFAEAGLASGNTQFSKSQSPRSNYSFDEWTPGLLVGAGVAYRLNPQFEVTASYRAIQYDEVSFESYHPTTGAHVETLYSDPRSTYGSVGLRYQF